MKFHRRRGLSRSRGRVARVWISAALAAVAASPGLAGPPAEASAAGPEAAKTVVASARLLLPYFEVDTTDPQGATTLFAVRNERDVPAEVDVEYYRTGAPQAPQLPARRWTLAPKEVRTVNLRFVPDLEVDADGIARGYVLVRAVTAGAAIEGDYFRVTPGEDFATGFRLLDVDSLSAHNDLCGLFSIRFLNGGGFDSGTRFILWIDADEAPDPKDPVLAFSAYDEAGNLLVTNLFFADEVAFEVEAAALLEPVASEDFGSMELQLTGGRIGHLSAVMSAAGRYSVGFEAACGDL